MDKSLWIDTNGAFLNNIIPEWIHKLNLWKTGLQIESTIQVVWKQVEFVNHNSKKSMDFDWFFICFVYNTKDLWRFVRFSKIRENRLKLLKILRIRGQELNRIVWNSGFVDHDTNRTFLKLRICNTNLLEVRQDSFSRFESNPRVHNSLIPFPQPYKLTISKNQFSNLLNIPGLV